MPEQQLISLLTDTESYHVERTTATDDMDKFCQAICAFSNDISGSGKNGYLILGAHNNGELSGLKVSDKLLLQISNIRTDGNILPQPVMTVEKFSALHRHNDCRFGHPDYQKRIFTAGCSRRSFGRG